MIEVAIWSTCTFTIPYGIIVLECFSTQGHLFYNLKTLIQRHKPDRKSFITKL